MKTVAALFKRHSKSLLHFSHCLLHLCSDCQPPPPYLWRTTAEFILGDARLIYKLPVGLHRMPSGIKTIVSEGENSVMAHQHRAYITSETKIIYVPSLSTFFNKHEFFKSP